MGTGLRFRPWRKTGAAARPPFRPPAEAELHDRVLRAAAAAFDPGRFEVYTNPGPFRRVAVGHVFPDVVVCLRSSVWVAAVGEVETASTVAGGEAEEWAEMAGLGVEASYLFVPRGWEERAAALLEDRGAGGRLTLVTYRDYGGAVLLGDFGRPG